MAWVQLFPTGATLISDSVNQIQDNWLFLQNNINTDHFFNTGAPTEGHHKYVYMPQVQGADPVVAAPESVFYSKAVAGTSQAFFTNGTTVTQLTGPSPTIGSSGSTFLPGGLILKWGIFGMGAGVTQVTVPYAGGAFPTAYYSVVITSTSSTTANEAGVNLGASNTSQFTAFRTGGDNISYFYIAIGI